MKFSKILKAAKVNDQYIFKLAWKPTWVSMNAFTSEEVAQNYIKEKRVKEGKRKTRRGKRKSKSQK